MSQASSMSTDGPSNAPGHPQKSKTLATWAAVLGGPFGLHRFYLYGLNDVLGWLLPIPTLLGAWGVRRVLELGQDDHLSWVLLPLLGLTVAACMLQGIVFGLTPDERWAVVAYVRALQRAQVGSVADVQDAAAKKTLGIQ